MKATVVRYRTHPGTARENAERIADVFAELRQQAPRGLRYTVLRIGETEFLHVAVSEEDPSPLPGLPAFQRFREGVSKRCAEPPHAVQAELIGDFRSISG